MLMGHLGNRLKIRDIVLRVSYRLNVNGLGLVVDRRSNRIRLVDVDELCVDA